jgi:hypothetical protein
VLNWSAVKVVNQVWNDELRKEVIELYNRKFSQSQIARTMQAKVVGMTITSSSIASLLRRLRVLGLIEGRLKSETVKKGPRATPIRLNPFKKHKVSKVTRNLAREPVHSTEVDFSDTSDVVFDPSMQCLIDDLNADRCRWPLGPMMSFPPFDYCGCKTIPPSPYCKGHTIRGVDQSRGMKKRYVKDE